MDRGFVHPEWMKLARCKETDPEVFFPERGDSTLDTLAAKRICFGCEVRVECLQYAIDNDEQHGIWGGLNERSRSKLQGKRVA
jgi:WhiB family redox-sensing transcriptional regulator